MTQKEKDEKLEKIDSMYDKPVKGGWDYMDGKDDALLEIKFFVNNMDITE